MFKNMSKEKESNLKVPDFYPLQTPKGIFERKYLNISQKNLRNRGNFLREFII